MIFAQKSVGNHFKNSQAHSQDTCVSHTLASGPPENGPWEVISEHGPPPSKVRGQGPAETSCNWSLYCRAPFEWHQRSSSRPGGEGRGGVPRGRLFFRDPRQKYQQHLLPATPSTTPPSPNSLLGCFFQPPWINQQRQSYTQSSVYGSKKNSLDYDSSEKYFVPLFAPEVPVPSPHD